MNSILAIAQFVSGTGLLLFGLVWIMTTRPARSGGFSASTVTIASLAAIGMVISSVVWLITFIALAGGG